MCSSLRVSKSLALSAALCLAVFFVCKGVFAQQEFESWHLEPSLGQSHLAMVARVASISRLTVVEGAKTDVALREYRFQPVQRLKGIFQRDQLSMTTADLGLSAGDEHSAPPLREGEFRLMILVQQPGNRSYGCVAAAPGVMTFDERVPLLTGPDDPLVSVVKTLIQVADAGSRRERAKLLVDRLTEVEGLAAVPLLSSLRLRADWAAADDRTYASLARFVSDSSSVVRGAALEVLHEMLANQRMSNDAAQLDAVAQALHGVLDSDELATRSRLAALTGLGHLLALKPDLEGSRELLIEQLNRAATHTERAAAATALAQIDHPQAIAAVLDALAALPLDELPAREEQFATAAVKLDAAGSEQILLARLDSSIKAEQSLVAEIKPLGELASRPSLPLLLTAASKRNLAPISVDRYHIAEALGRLGDDQAVPVLVDWLRGNDHRFKERVLTALETIDSPVAARELRPLLKSEGHLPLKLRIARLLARHGYADGYSLATEHLADVGQTASAALVLAALDDPRTTQQLSAILQARPDRRWHAAALTGLAAIGDAGARTQLLEILADERHPLAADAAEAAGLAGNSELLPPLAALLQSRNNEISRAALVALRRFLSDVRSSPRGLAAAGLDNETSPPDVDLPQETRTQLAMAVSALLADTYVEISVRREALAVARLLGGKQYSELLSDLADQAEIEATPLLGEVQVEQRRLQKVARQP